MWLTFLFNYVEKFKTQFERRTLYLIHIDNEIKNNQNSLDIRKC